jgi:hypothetical protein
MPQNINTNTTLSTLVIAAQKAKALAVFQSLVDGINTELADVSSYVISGKTYTKADLLAVLTARIDAGKQTLAARTAMHLAVAKEQTLLPTALALREGVKLFLAMRYGKESPMLQKFGYAQRKTTQTAAVTTANAVKKSAATRAARGTTGKKAKSLVKGAPPAAPPPTTAAPTVPTASPPAPAAPAAAKAVATPTGATA